MKDLLLAETGLCVDVAVPLPVTSLFTYRVPEEQISRVRAGVRVRVPFRKRELIGYIVEARDGNLADCKPVLEVLDEEPVISEAMLALTRWIGEEYGAGWGEAIENALPRWVKFGKKAERALAREKTEALVPGSGRKTTGFAADSQSRGIEPRGPDFKLTADQQTALQTIREGFEQDAPRPVLLFGVTGSGKSEVYIRAIRDVLARQRSAICLVPEIALTEQLHRFFLKHFGPHLEILHSKLNDTERFLAWKRIERGQRRVILGPRSAVFAPARGLGLILIDEEHEGSYKQETAPRYHAREVAAWRARQEKALLVMGSATPSLETMYRTETGEVVRVDLKTRVEDRALPEVRLIDMKKESGHRSGKSFLSIPLMTEIEKNLAAGEGTMLLLNRRGFSTHIYNTSSGDLVTCKHCQVSLTYHQEEDILLCHYCNFRQPVREFTKGSDASFMRFSGFGTEKIESDVARRWPQARIARLDADSIRRKGSHEKILEAFRDRKIDILIGTQMIAKGFDFPHVTLVGVILADVGLMLPDFRSSERTFQLLTQVAGRAGRGEKTGRVLIQTFSPGHPSVRYAKEHDYGSFYLHEMPSRQEYQYPPYFDLINFIIRSRDENRAYLYAREWRDRLRGELAAKAGSAAGSVSLVGPSPLPFYKLRGHFRWHVMIKLPRKAPLRKALWDLMAGLKKSSTVAMAVDVNPVNIL